MSRCVVTFTTTFIYGVDASNDADAIDKARIVYTEDLQAAGSEVALYNSDAVVRAAQEDDDGLFD